MNKVYRTEGRYDFLHPQEKSAQYVFTYREDAPKNLNRSFLVELDKDGAFSGSPLEVAYQIQEVYNSYWIHTEKDRIDAVVKYLEKWDDKDYYDGLKVERERLHKRLEEVEKNLKSFDPEEWDNWTPEQEAESA